MVFARTALLTSALSLVASGALADLTADAVWDDLSQWFSTAAELSVGSESRSGDTLTITDIVVTQEFELDGQTSGTVTTLPSLELVEQDDGSVRVILPETMTVKSSSTAGEETVDVDMSITQSGTEVVASGDDQVERYDYTSDTMTLVLDNMKASDPDSDIPSFDATVTLEEVEGAYVLAGDDALREIRSSSTVGRMGLDMNGTAPADQGDGVENFKISGQIANVTGAGTATIPMNLMDTADANAMLEAGFRVTGEMDYGQGGYSVEGTGADGTFKMDTTTDSGTFGITMSPEGLVYAASNTGTRFEVSGDQMPFPAPLVFEMAESGAEFRMPVMASDADQPFGLELRLIDLVLPDIVYMMFDPAGMLPHDPASLVIDLEGTGRLESPILDPVAMADQENLAGELKSLDITELRLTAVGAELTGDGAFTFSTGADGIPVPAGTANLMLTGGNALLDALVNMGLVPEQQAMGARMMIGMFARPGDGEDTLVSTIEMTEDGQILANGQRIR